MILSYGLNINGRLVITKTYYLEENSKLEILLFEKETKREQKFILDNVDFSKLTHQELLNNARQIVQHIEYVI